MLLFAALWKTELIQLSLQQQRQVCVQPEKEIKRLMRSNKFGELLLLSVTLATLAIMYNSVYSLCGELLGNYH